MTFPLRHIPSSLPFFVVLPVHHISSPVDRATVGVLLAQGFFVSAVKTRRSLALSNRRLGKSEEGAGAGGCSRLRRSTDRGQRRPRSRVETGKSSLVSHMGRRGRVRETANRVPGRPAGPRIHTALLSRGELSTGRTTAACGTKRRGRSRGEPSRTLQIFAEQPEREITEGPE